MASRKATLYTKPAAAALYTDARVYGTVVSVRLSPDELRQLEKFQELAKSLDWARSYYRPPSRSALVKAALQVAFQHAPKATPKRRGRP
jgi:predicted transcriptional regulator